MIGILPTAILAGIVGAIATPQIGVPKLYDTTNEEADFVTDGYNIPGVYKDLDWSMGTFSRSQYTITSYVVLGVVPPDFEGGASLQGRNGSMNGYLSSDYTNSSVDHFAMNSMYAGCNILVLYGDGPGDPSPGSGNRIPLPANCTINVKGFSKLNPLGPVAAVTYHYRPQERTSYGFTAARMDAFTFPATFKFLDKIVLTATLDNVPSNADMYYRGNGSAYEVADGLELLFTAVSYNVSRFAPSL